MLLRSFFTPQRGGGRGRTVPCGTADARRYPLSIVVSVAKRLVCVPAGSQVRRDAADSPHFGVVLLGQPQRVRVPPRLAFKERAGFERQLFVHDIRVDETSGFQRQLVRENLSGDFADDRNRFRLDRPFDNAAFGDDQRQAIDLPKDGSLNDEGAGIVDTTFNGGGARDRECAADTRRRF